MLISQRSVIFAAMLGLIWSCSLAQASPTPPHLCETAAKKAAEASGVPLDVMQAIMLLETGTSWQGNQRPWPWTINDGQDGHWFNTQAEALTFAQGLIETGKTSFDLGCFQLNYRWHAQNFSSLAQMLDPEANAAYAARFLAELKATRTSWPLAAGAYHSLTPEFSEKYQEKFNLILAKIQDLPPVIASKSPAGELPASLAIRLARSAGSLVPLYAGAARPLIEVR